MLWRRRLRLLLPVARCAVMAEFMELLDSPTFKSYGSSLKLVMVAEGQAHIYPRRV